MSIILVIATMILWILLYTYNKSVVKATVETWILNTVMTWCITELLSALECWTKTAVFISWVVVVIALIAIGIRTKMFKQFRNIYANGEGMFHICAKHKTMVHATIIYWVVLGVIAILRSQSLIDNMTHRLVRIMHWMQNGSVGTFATNSIRQVQYSALVEYMNAQFLILGANDRLMNIIQVEAFLFSGLIIYGICRKLHIGFRLSVVASWLYWLMPMGIVEVITLQTDVVAAVYLLAFIYYLLDFIQADKLCLDKIGIWKAVNLALSAVLGYLAKPTVCFAMVVFLIWMAITRLIKKDKIYVLFTYLFVGCFILVLFLAPSYIRQRNTEQVNTANNKNIEISTDKSLIQHSEDEERIRVFYNLSHPKAFTMACVENLAANSTSRCLPQINAWMQRVVDKIYSEISNGESEFRIFVSSKNVGETNEPSPCIMWLTVIAVGILLLKRCKLSLEQQIFFWCAIASLIIEAGLMGYTYFRQRYLLGVMAVLCICIAMILNQLKTSADNQKIAVIVIIGISSLGALNIMTYELQKVIDGFSGGKNHQYYVDIESVEPYYEGMVSYVNTEGYTKIGVLGDISYEYIFWQTIDNLDRMEAVNVKYASLKPYEDMSYRPECILAEGTQQYYLEHQIECHNANYECVWESVDENGKCYSVLHRIE